MKPYYLLIALAIGIIIGYFSSPEKEAMTIISTIVERDTIYDKTTDTLEIVKWYPKVIKEPQDTFFIEYDSTQLLEIARLFYSKYFFDTTITISECEINFNTLISQNQPFNSMFTVTNNRATEINNTTTNIIQPLKYNWFVGGGIEGNLNELDVYGSITHIRGRIAYNAGYGFLGKEIKLGIGVGF
jgi:hypothetical protein